MPASSHSSAIRFGAALAFLVVVLTGCKVLVGSLIRHLDRWDNGVVKREGELRDGEQTGTWVFNYPDGRVRARGEYRNDRQFGRWVYFYEGGTEEYVGEFDPKGLRTGRWTYRYPNEQVRAEGHYHEDFEAGPWTFRRADGSVEQEGWFHRGKKSGPWTRFREDGRKAAEGLYHRGQQVGRWRFWDGAGQLSAKDFGVPPGCELVREAWSEDEGGGIRRTGVLQGGELVGTWTARHPGGAMRFACSFTSGTPDGWFQAGRADGTLLARGRLTSGRFQPGCVAFGQTGDEQEIVAGPMPAQPPMASGWSDPAVADQKPAAEVVAMWLNESRDSTMGDGALAGGVEGEEALPEAPEQLVAEGEAMPPRVPAPFQPSWTIRQEKELPEWVDAYVNGFKKRGGPAGSRYGPVRRKGDAGPRQRTELKGRPLPVTRFETVDGGVVDTADFLGKKRLMVVVLRGFAGEVCIYCVAQTKALAQSKARFDAIGMEVLVVYPGPKGNEQAFMQAYEETFGTGAPPYRVCYDPDLELVSKLGIQGGDLAYPTTIVLGKDGKVELAFVGEHKADRPAAKKLVELIKDLGE